MGVGPFQSLHGSSCSCEKSRVTRIETNNAPITMTFNKTEIIENPNPVPDNFFILNTEQIGNYVLAEIQYPDCTNYEGKKILLYANEREGNILLRKSIDPHFYSTCNAPIARFVPTKKGWEMGRALAGLYSEIEVSDDANL